MGEVGGLLSGVNPFHYNPGSPITLYLFQACLIMATCNLIHIPFSKIRQPKVISEVIAGVILGPTVLGQIPGYTDTIFPSSSIPGLNLTANLGIILFMFFLGLEVDIAFIKKHMKSALSIGLVTLAVPFGCGCLIAIPLFRNYANKDPTQRHIKFTVFMVFIAVSMAVTAFPVLSRILNELRLLKERPGIIVLGAGIINDILGWVLLALSVILSSAESSPVNTVYILLITLAWFLIYFYPLKYVLRWALIKTHELDRSKPSPIATMCILFIMFISAYFTDIIGVHAIFGAFIAGLIVPRENHYVVKLTERMEDIPNIILIPIYFAVAGLNVDLTLLNEGKDWGYVFLSIAVAIASKIVSGTAMAKLHGLFWRESVAIGVLMSCKGIVEIVVLTVGLNAGIISHKIFGMFILMALVSTFVTTPLTQLVYPDSYRQRLKTELESDQESKTVILVSEGIEKEEPNYMNWQDLKSYSIPRVINVINTPEIISSSLEFLNFFLFKGTKKSGSKDLAISRVSTGTTVKSSSKFKKITQSFRKNNEEFESKLETIGENPAGFSTISILRAIHLRLMTERTTDLLHSSSLHNDDPHFTANSDYILNIFEIFSNLSRVPFSSEVIFSTMREKGVNATGMEMTHKDLILFPLKGASYEYKGNPTLLNEKYTSFEHIFSHIVGLNELPSTFFSTLSTDLKANFAMLISNTCGRLSIERMKRKHIVLLLPNPNLTYSDFLGLFILLRLSFNDSISHENVIFSIYFNNLNSTFIKDFNDFISDQYWFENTNVKILGITAGVKNESDNRSESFIESVLSQGLSIEEVEDLEESTFIIAENKFSPSDPFENDVKQTIYVGANRRFNVLVVHYFNFRTKSGTI
ncbi:K(+)/H(+) antiporter 1 [Nakaseomyces bracarensis]|uniref:K(+)/H(+) antiporter 1 n=1 Tax=Nakaseomyces bracarensis TaxID=273131 RepID=A0ABR4NUU8_9SACH